MSTEHAAAGRSEARATLALLLRKELLVFRRHDYLLVFGVFFLAAVQAIYLDETFLLLGMVLAATLAIYVPVIEWLQDTDPMLHSLPVGRDTVVVGRYLVSLIVGGIGGLVWSVTGRLLFPILLSERTAPAMWMTPEGILAFVLAVGLFVVLFFPFYFRLGMGWGAVTFLAASLVLLGLGYGTAGLAWGPSAAGQGGFFPPTALLRSRIAALLGSMGLAGTITMILLGLAVAAALSIKLSQRAFRAREL